MKPTLIHLPPDLISRLDARAERDNVSRSQLVRDAIADLLSSEPNADLEARTRAAYERHPLSEPDEWGDLESFLDAVRSSRTDSE